MCILFHEWPLTDHSLVMQRWGISDIPSLAVASCLTSSEVKIPWKRCASQFAVGSTKRKSPPLSTHWKNPCRMGRLQLPMAMHRY